MPAAVRKDGDYSQTIAVAWRTCGGVAVTPSGQQESQAAPLSAVVHMYQRQRAVRGRRIDPSQFPSRCHVTVSHISSFVVFQVYLFGPSLLLHKERSA